MEEERLARARAVARPTAPAPITWERGLVLCSVLHNKKKRGGDYLERLRRGEAGGCAMRLYVRVRVRVSERVSE